MTSVYALPYAYVYVTNSLTCVEKTISSFFVHCFCVWFSSHLIAGAVPTINLPQKSIPSTSTAETRRDHEVLRHEVNPKPYYSSLEDLKRKVKSLKLTDRT